MKGEIMTADQHQMSVRDCLNAILTQIEQHRALRNECKYILAVTDEMQAAYDAVGVLLSDTPPKSQGVEEAIAWAKKEILASREKANDCRFPDHIAKLSLIYAQRLESLISATRQQDGRVEGLVKALENALPFIRKDLHSKLANLEFTALEQALRAFRSKE